MAYRELSDQDSEKTSPKGKRRWLKLFIAGGVIVLGLGGFFMYKTTNLFSKISTRNGSFLKAFIKSEDEIKGFKEGRINVLLLGMRGENIPGGSLLADTIMLVSLKPEENKVAMISVPRDLHTNIPGYGYSRKINAAHVLGEREEEGKGMELMQKIIEEVCGIPVHYTVTVNFQAMREVVDTLGGVEVHLDKPFEEPTQFVEGQECGGVFSLPAGDVTLNGEQSLCYARARFASSDFDRARRQQDILMGMKEKALATGTLTSFSKVNSLAGIVGDNVRTNMASWEMQKLFGIAQRVDNPEIVHKVLDNSPDGFLYSTSLDTDDGPAYVLLPRGDSFEYVQKLCQNIFDQSVVEGIQPPTYVGSSAPVVVPADEKKDKKKDKKKEDKKKEDKKTEDESEE